MSKKRKDLYSPLCVAFVLTAPGAGERLGVVEIPVAAHTIDSDYEIDLKTLRQELLISAHEAVKVKLLKGEVERVRRAIKARRKYART